MPFIPPKKPFSDFKHYFFFSVPVIDYFIIMWNNKQFFVYEWAIPIILAFFSIDRTGTVLIKTFNLGFIVTLLGSMLAFSIAIMTIIISLPDSIKTHLQSKMTQIKVKEQSISIYDMMMVNISYTIIIEGLLTMFAMFFMVRTSWLNWVSISTTLLFTAQTILVNMRTVTNVYLVYISKEENI